MLETRTAFCQTTERSVGDAVSFMLNLERHCQHLLLCVHTADAHHRFERLRGQPEEKSVVKALGAGEKKHNYRRNEREDGSKEFAD